MNYSTEQAARVVQVLMFFGSLLGWNLGVISDELTPVVGAIIFLGATIYGWYKRYKRGDLNLFGGRV